MRPFRSCLVSACLVLVCRVSFAAEPQWVEVRSPNFSVITDAGEKRGRAAALRFEQMRAVFGTLMTKANVNLSVPLQIVAFRNSKELRQVAPIFNGKPTEMAGLFQGGEDRCFIMLDMSVPNPWPVVFHEYAHRLLEGNLAMRTDPWFEEGFAEYFSSIEVDGKQAHVGKVSVETHEMLRQVGLMKLTDLLRVQQYTKTYNESGDRRNTFYAQSGLAVHYLYDNQLVQKLGDYFYELKQTKLPLEQAIQKAFGMSPEQFDKALRDYFYAGRYRYYRLPAPAGIAADQFTATPVSLADARALIADIHAHSLDHKDKAVAEFEEVLKMAPDNASALRGLGFAYLQQRDLPRAAEYLKRAVELDSKDARVHYYHAMLLNQGGMVDESKAAEMKKELQAAIALDPKLADAYSLLGFAQAMSGEREEGIKNLKKSIELAPREERYQFNLANVYMMDRKMDEAISVFKNLSSSSNPEVAFRASQALAQAEDFKTHGIELRIRGASENVSTVKQESGFKPESSIQEPPSEPIKVSSGPVRFVKGKLGSVDCSAAPAVLFTVTAGVKSLRLHVRDRTHLVVIGADEFACDWKGRTVAVNYRERPDGDGDVVSVEVQ